MGTTTESSGLLSALFGPVQQRLLGLLFGQPERRFQSAELIRLARSGTGAVHRQLQALAGSGLIVVSRVGNQKFYQANRESPIFHELHGIARKTVGLTEPLKQALEPLTDKITTAFVYGSIADASDRAGSDIDVMILSDTIDYAEAFEALQPAESMLGRAINPTVMSPADWQRKRAAADSFAARVAQGPKLFVIGDEHDVS